MSTFSRICGWILAGAGLLLLLNAGAKLLKFDEFVDAVANYRLAPLGSEPWIAGAVLLGEALIGAGMLVPRHRLRGTLVCAAMLTFFSMVAASSVMNGLDVECGCYTGAVSTSRVGWPLVARNVGFIGFLLVAVGGHLGPKPWRDDYLFRHFAEPPIAALSLGLVLVMTQTFYLAQQNYQLQVSLKAGGQLARIELGDRLTPFEALPVEGGAAQRIAFLDSPATVVAIFSTKCPFCRDSVDAWNTAHDAGVRVIGVSLSSIIATQQFIEQRGARFPVYVPASRSGFARDYRVQKVPQTIRLNREGAVLAVQRGKVLRVESAPAQPANDDQK